MPTLAEVIAALDGWYPPATAESWDAVGLTCGDPAEPVTQILLALDCVPETVAEAVATGAQLLLTHHPLLLSGVHSVAADHPKGALVHQLIRAKVAHFAAHTNADVAEHGVSQALADVLGLREVRPLAPDPAPAVDHLSVFVPPPSAAAVLAALSDAGAGAIGDYDQCHFEVTGTGSFRPLAGAHPFEGTVGELHSAAEIRLSVVLPRRRRAQVLAAMRHAHPYEEVAFELTEQPSLPGRTGTGRIGVLAAPLSLAEFTDHVARVLPRTVWGVRAAGDPDQLVSTVAVCGGSGGSYSELARAAGADAFLTADQKHHGVSEQLPAGMALVDAAHWATEAPWLPVVGELLRAAFGPALKVSVSELVTDPWTVHAK